MTCIYGGECDGCGICFKDDKEYSIAEDKTIKGFEGFGPEEGKFIPYGDAVDYAMDCWNISFQNKPPRDEAHAAEFRTMILEWFYSGGNWIEVLKSL